MIKRKTSDGRTTVIYDDGIVFLTDRTLAYNRRPLTAAQAGMLADIMEEVPAAELGFAIDAVRTAADATDVLRTVARNSGRIQTVGA